MGFGFFLWLVLLGHHKSVSSEDFSLVINHKSPTSGHIPCRININYWLVVSTPLKNISQLGLLFPIYGKIKNVPNHQPVIDCCGAFDRSVHARRHDVMFFLVMFFLGDSFSDIVFVGSFKDF